MKSKSPTHSNVVRIGTPPVVPEMLVEYRKAIAGGVSALIQQGRFNKNDTLVMVGFLSAAIIAWRCTGNEKMASKFEAAATSINNDWKIFERIVQELCSELDEEISQMNNN